MEIIEWVAVISGVLAVYLLYMNNVLTWPVGFVNIFCFLWTFWNTQLYGDFAVNVMFLIVGIWGWINWNRRSDKLPGILSGKQRIIIGIATLVSIPLTMYYLENYTKCSYPLLEAAILSLSITGQWLTAKRKLENWILWIAADILMVIVYALKGLELYSAYAFIILIIGCTGLYQWNKTIKLAGNPT